MSKKFVVFTNGNYFAAKILHDTLHNYKNDIAAVFIVKGDYKARKGFRSLYHLSRNTANQYILYKIWSIVLLKLINTLTSKIFDVKDLCKKLNIKFYEVDDINSEESLNMLEGIQPEYIISVSCPQLIKKKILSMIRSGINIHASLLPEYAGLAPYFWVLKNKEKETGITVHYLVKGFDKGNILVQKKFKIDKNYSSFKLFEKLSSVGNEILPEAIEMMLNNSPGTTQNLSGYSYFSNPAGKDYKDFKKNKNKLISYKDILDLIKA